jgi:excisionase family DNA binding protein
MNRETYTVGELAPILGCSKNHLYTLIARGEFPGVIRLGNKVVISKRAVAEMLGSDTTGIGRHLSDDGGTL